LFNALAGMHQRVGNYPGVTVETKKGRMSHGGQTFDLIDLPGIYSLAPRSLDEMAAVDLLLGRQVGEAPPDAVLDIVDASNLERHLYLTTQALELGLPMVIALNRIDVAESLGLRLDPQRLSRQLGMPVVPIQANRGIGLDQLKQVLLDCLVGQASPLARASEDACPTRLQQLRAIPFPEAFEREAACLHEHLGGTVPPFLVRRLLLDIGGYAEKQLAGFHDDLAQDVQQARQRLAAAGSAEPALEAQVRYGWINQATAGCVERSQERPPRWTDRIDRVLTNRLWGTLIFLAVMFVVFESIFTWARPLMAGINSAKDALEEIVRGLLPPGPFTSLLCDGVIEGVGSILVFLPQILILCGLVSVLEECGYMARAAFLMDRVMAACGLNGRSFIPLLSSLACAVPGIMAARVIENRRDRLATILVAPLMSCSARLPVYTLLIGAFLTDGFAWWLPGLTLFSLYSLGLVLTPLVALLVKRTLLRGGAPVFVLEMPLYSWPSPWTVLRRILDSAWSFLSRAGSLILAAMIVTWAFLYFPRAESERQSLSLVDPETGTGEVKEVETYDLHVAALEEQQRRLQGWVMSTPGPAQQQLCEEITRLQDEIHRLNGAWKRQSLLGRLGQALEPTVRPLGWDWRIGMAVLASFPAREVVVGTLGILCYQGKVDTEEIRTARNAGETSLGRALKEQQVFTVPSALSVMVFFALCCQCVSTLAIIRRETNSWRWSALTFVYMTTLAYIGALGVFQVTRLVL
jgi:ferrous iron transport protein B